MQGTGATVPKGEVYATRRRVGLAMNTPIFDAIAAEIAERRDLKPPPQPIPYFPTPIWTQAVTSNA